MHTSFTPNDSLAVFPPTISHRTIWVYSDATAVCMLIFATYKKKWVWDQKLFSLPGIRNFKVSVCLAKIKKPTYFTI